MYGTQENDVYFFGETVEKVGDEEVPDHATAASAPACSRRLAGISRRGTATILNLDHYTLLQQLAPQGEGRAAALPAGPLLPDRRRTSARPGFLIPTYGTSTVRGQSLHNAFFWAIDRSQDATFLHDWFSKTGQGFGGEYRYNRGPAVGRLLPAYMLREHDASYTDAGGNTVITPATRELRAAGHR